MRLNGRIVCYEALLLLSFQIFTWQILHHAVWHISLTNLRVFNIAGIPVALIISPTQANSTVEVEITKIREIPVS